MGSYPISQVAGFVYLPNFIDMAEASALINAFQALTWENIEMHGIIAKRKVVHFGVGYHYGRRDVIDNAMPPPSYLKTIIEKVACLMEIRPIDIAEILLTYYPIGAGIGWHKDSPAFGEKIVGLSLAGPCTFKLRKKISQQWQVFKIELAPYSAYLLSGEARYTWQHSILPVKSPRYSLTFRTLQK